MAYWRQIVTTMRAVPGEKFKFLWNPNAPSPTIYTPTEAYPGNAYVDYVGTDVYDNFWGKPFTPAAAWVHQLTEQWGLDWLSAFAVEHDKPIAIPEWSDEYRTDGHGLGDDPSFIDNMAGLVRLQQTWPSPTSGPMTPRRTYRNNLLDGTFPKALARFRGRLRLTGRVRVDRPRAKLPGCGIGPRLPCWSGRARRHEGGRTR